MPSQKDAPFDLNGFGKFLMREAIRCHQRPSQKDAPFGLNGFGKFLIANLA